jgi:ribosomal protein L18
VAHGQKKAIAGRKGKRLGGVVKRAMKAAAPKKK